MSSDFLPISQWKSASRPRPQNQAKCARLFLYREVLGVELPWLDNVEQARAPKRLPVVLTREEVQAMLSRRDSIDPKEQGVIEPVVRALSSVTPHVAQ